MGARMRGFFGLDGQDQQGFEVTMPLCGADAGQSLRWKRGSI